MNNAELNKILKAAPLPERSKEYWESFPGTVEFQLRHPLPERPPARWAMPRIAWALAIALCCLLAGYFAGHRGAAKSAAENDQLLQNQKFLQELTAMFPDRVRAVVKDETGVHLLLSDQPDVPESRPVWVRICRGKTCTTVVTFSGQELRVAGENMTVLTDAENRVILAGDRFAWTSSGDGKTPSDLKIQAHTLEFASR